MDGCIMVWRLLSIFLSLNAAMILSSYSSFPWHLAVMCHVYLHLPTFSSAPSSSSSSSSSSFCSTSFPSTFCS